MKPDYFLKKENFEQDETATANPIKFKVKSKLIIGIIFLILILFVLFAIFSRKPASSPAPIVENQEEVKKILPPNQLVAARPGESQVKLEWGYQRRNHSGYEIERGVDSNSNFIKIGVVGQNISSFADNNIENGKTYYYRIRAFRAMGKAKEYLPYSNTVVAEIKN